MKLKKLTVLKNSKGISPLYSTLLLILIVLLLTFMIFWFLPNYFKLNLSNQKELEKVIKIGRINPCIKILDLSVSGAITLENACLQSYTVDRVQIDDNFFKLSKPITIMPGTFNRIQTGLLLFNGSHLVLIGTLEEANKSEEFNLSGWLEGSYLFDRDSLQAGTFNNTILTLTNKIELG